MTHLPTFAARALRQLPTSFWWVVAALVGASLSIMLEKELFPNTPAAAPVANWVLVGCGLTLPPLGVGWLWRVALLVHHPGWRLLWYLAARVTTGLLLVALLGALVFLLRVAFL